MSALRAGVFELDCRVAALLAMTTKEGHREVCAAGRRPRPTPDHTFGNFTHFAPRWPLFTAVSMKAMPAMPSVIVGKS